MPNVRNYVDQYDQFTNPSGNKMFQGNTGCKGKPVIDFGARRAHGIESAEALAEASYLTGFSATATVSAGIKSGLPIAGTMAHSFVMSFKTELRPSEHMQRNFPKRLLLLVDTYDTAKRENPKSHLGGKRNGIVWEKH
ncbi:MAG: hypothetical protein CM1200mP3_05520 [Chloroflexota bacterium]|nr:MAG: hypothetical protein CM1200mP3_05520 [Chloroflexota bacterium]